MLEDSIHIRKRLRGMIEESTVPVTIVEAGSVHEALHAVSEFEPELAILDLHLPDGVCFPVIDQVLERLPQCIVTVLTAFDDTEVRETCLQRGAHYFLSKIREFESVLEILEGMRP